eukprot:IDg9089t1
MITVRVLTTAAADDCSITSRLLTLSDHQLLRSALHPSPKGVDQVKLPPLQQPHSAKLPSVAEGTTTKISHPI